MKTKAVTIIAGILQDPTSIVRYVPEVTPITTRERYMAISELKSSKYNAVIIYVTNDKVTHISFSLAGFTDYFYSVEFAELATVELDDTLNPYKNLSVNSQVYYELIAEALSIGKVEFIKTPKQLLTQSLVVLDELRASGLGDTLYIATIKDKATPLIECDLGYVSLVRGIYSMHL